MALRIFISYRRSDSQDIAARVNDRLAVIRGIKSVFLDVAEIAAGESFPERLQRALVEADVCLVLIGKHWAGGTGEHDSRIARPDDFVALEVSRALSLGKRVIPVLLNDAIMPNPANLPGPVRALTERNALFVRHQSFNQDIQLLADAVLGRSAIGSVRRLSDRWPALAWMLKLSTGLALGLGVLLLLGLVHNVVTRGQSLEASLGSRSMLALVVLAVMGGGALAPFWWSARGTS